jgi:hypothetical protein
MAINRIASARKSAWNGECDDAAAHIVVAGIYIGAAYETSPSKAAKLLADDLHRRLAKTARKLVCNRS